MKDFISDKTAKLAKEKGFEYTQRIFTFSPYPLKSNGSFNDYSGVAQSFLQNWLREEHKLHVIAVPSNVNKGHWHFHRFDLMGLGRDSEPELAGGYSTYEEAFEQGLYWALNQI